MLTHLKVLIAFVVAVFVASGAQATTAFSYSFDVTWETLTANNAQGLLRSDPSGDYIDLGNYTTTSATSGRFFLSDQLVFGETVEATLDAEVDKDGNITALSCTVLVCQKEPIGQFPGFFFNGTASSKGVSFNSFFATFVEVELNMTVGGSGSYSYLSDFDDTFFSDDTYISVSNGIGESGTLKLGNLRLTSTSVSPVPLPAGMGLLGTAVLGLGFGALRRRCKA